MQKRVRWIGVVAMSVLIMGTAAVGYADHHGETQDRKAALVISVEATDQGAYLKKVSEIKAITEGLGVGATMRVWQDRGSSDGTARRGAGV